ncbi:MAG: hypothetical protein WB870_13320 [Gallionellaceae bacterium]
MKLKFKVLILVAALASSQAFAGSGDYFDPSGAGAGGGMDLSLPSGGDISAITTDAEGMYAGSAGADSVYTQDVAVISQTGDYSYAMIEQDTVGGTMTGNFAAITQSSALPAVAYIYQGGTNAGGNFAMINQHD